MSESYVSGTPNDPDTSPQGGEGKSETAKHEAREVAETAKSEAGHVAETAKQEVGTVVAEAKSQARDLYAHTTRELSEQADAQQGRAAAGLKMMGDELRGMSDNSTQSGLATDLVREASSRLSRAGSWLEERDSRSLFREVKSYARRHPGTFIAAAAVVGVVAGRLTRALASNNDDETPSSSSGWDVAPGITGGGTTTPPVPRQDPNDLAAVSAVDTPLYSQRVAGLSDDAIAESPGYDRSDTV